MLIGGFFDFPSTTRHGIARLNTNGTLDATFNPGAGANFGTVYSIVLQLRPRVDVVGPSSHPVSSKIALSFNRFALDNTHCNRLDPKVPPSPANLSQPYEAIVFPELSARVAQAKAQPCKVEIAVRLRKETTSRSSKSLTVFTSAHQAEQAFACWRPCGRRAMHASSRDASKTERQVPRRSLTPLLLSFVRNRDGDSSGGSLACRHLYEKSSFYS